MVNSYNYLTCIFIFNHFPAGRDFQRTLTTLYFRPDRPPVVAVRINIRDDSVQEGEEVFTVELTAFDLSIVLVNSITQVVIIDDDIRGKLRNHSFINS